MTLESTTIILMLKPITIMLVSTIMMYVGINYDIGIKHTDARIICDDVPVVHNNVIISSNTYVRSDCDVGINNTDAGNHAMMTIPELVAHNDLLVS